MTAVSLPVVAARAAVPVTVALAGNPNAGKTTLFNQLTGLRGKTANFSGTTTSVRLGSFELDGKPIRMLDLPGLYGMSDHKIEERKARDALLGKLPGQAKPQAVIVVVDATNLARNLYLTGQVRELGVPMVVALNMIDLAETDGLEIDAESLAVELGAPVVPLNSRSGQGVEQLKRELDHMLEAGPEAIPALPKGIAACGTCTTCPHEARYDWAEEVGARAVRTAKGARLMSVRLTEKIDGWLTHPVFGPASFALIMAALFVSIFSIAQYPMTWIEAGFGFAGDAVGRILPPGDVNSFAVNGLVGGIGGVLVFLPQICFLFFLITLLEDTGYLARAAFVADRPMSRVGLPGRAFVPMLSAHACAIPAIMASRVIENRRDRLVAILVIPLLSCTARLPVYVMITALLFAGRPVTGGLVFTGAYLLGMTAAIGMAFVFKSTILPGSASPLVIELPRYRMPSLRNAALTAYERGRAFVTRAGTTILAVSVVLWVLATYPKLDESQLAAVVPAGTLAQVTDLRARAEAAEDETAAALEARADALLSSHRLEHSVAGRVGKALEPVFAPLGFDWKINVGVVSSFAAREVIVATLAIVYGIGEEGAEDEETLSATLGVQRHADGTPVFTIATSLALLVFFVLAMQCLPTNIVTRRETGSWKWPALQFGYMSVLAWTAAFAVYRVASALA